MRSRFRHVVEIGFGPVLLCAILSVLCSVDFISVMSAVANLLAGLGGIRQYPPPYPVDEYISPFVPTLDAPRFAMMPVGPAPTVKVGNEGRETAYAERRWKH